MSDGERLSGEHRADRLEPALSLLSHRREIAPDPAEEDRAFETAETSGDFLLHFVHPDILLSLIVREGCLEIVHEPEDFRLKVT